MKLNFAQITGKYASGILLFAVIAAATASFAFIVRPRIEALRTARAQFNRAKQEYDLAFARENEIKLFDEQIRSVPEESIHLLRALFLWPPPLAAVVSALDQRASASRFLLNSIEISEDRTGKDSSGPLSPISIHARLSGGGYRELKEVLTRITRAVPILDLSSFVFDPRSSALTLNLRGYRVSNLSREPAAIDPRFFSDPQFRALGSAPVLPSLGPIGRENPFAPFAVPEIAEQE